MSQCLGIDLSIDSPWTGPPFPFPAQIPVLADFTWSLQGAGVTATQKATGILLDCPVNKAGILLKTLSPTSGYQVQMAVRMASLLGNYVGVGIYLRQSSDGKGITFSRMYDSGQTGKYVYSVAQYTNGWVWSANKQFRAMTDFTFYGDEAIMRVRDDGATRYYELSPDGECWVAHYSEARTTFCVPNQAGFGGGAAAASYAMQALFTHFKIA